MIMTNVESTNLKAVGWESEKLFVEFHKSGTYVYEGVPIDLYNELISAPSAGRFLNQEVKPKFPAFHQPELSLT